MLSVIIPAYNEERTLDRVIRRVLAVRPTPQVIVVNDGSTDATGEVIAFYHQRGLIVGVEMQKNSGKGAAIRAGLQWADQPYTIIQDADLEYDPADFQSLLAPVRAGRGRVVFGSRNLHHPQMRDNHFQYMRYWLGGKIVTLAANLLFGARLTDEATCYKLFPTDLLRRMNLQSRGFEFCPEVTAKALRMGERIVEVPIRYAPRSMKEGKKIRAIDGLKAILVLMKYRLVPLSLLLRPWDGIGIRAALRHALPDLRRAA